MTHPVLTRPKCKIDIRKGLAPLRQKWMKNVRIQHFKRAETEYGQERLADEKLAARFDLTRQPRRRKRAKCHANALCPKSIITPEMEYIAIRENQNRAAYLESLAVPSAGRAWLR